MLELPAFLTPLERAVVELILDGLPKSQDSLRTQLNLSRRESRVHNGYGFYTTFAVPGNSLAAPLRNAHLGASAYVDDRLCGFLLWIEDGRVNFLEGYPLGGDAWPNNERPLSHNVAPNNKNFRDLRLDKSNVDSFD